MRRQKACHQICHLSAQFKPYTESINKFQSCSLCAKEGSKAFTNFRSRPARRPLRRSSICSSVAPKIGPKIFSKSQLGNPIKSINEFLFLMKFLALGLPGVLLSLFWCAGGFGGGLSTLGRWASVSKRCWCKGKEWPWSSQNSISSIEFASKVFQNTWISKSQTYKKCWTLVNVALQKHLHI